MLGILRQPDAVWFETGGGEHRAERAGAEPLKR